MLGNVVNFCISSTGFEMEADVAGESSRVHENVSTPTSTAVPPQYPEIEKSHDFVNESTNLGGADYRQIDNLTYHSLL